MIYPQDDTSFVASADTGTVISDRRRLGRREVSSALIPLLRGTGSGSTAEQEPVPLVDLLDTLDQTNGRLPLDDGGNPARGILIALLLSAAFPSIIAGIGYLIFHYCW